MRFKFTLLLLSALVWLSGCARKNSGTDGTSLPACTLSTSSLGASGIQVYPGPTGNDAYRSGRYSVEVFDGNTWQSSYTYGYSRTSKVPWHENSTPSVNFTTFATNRAVNVRITKLSGDNITSLAISPLNLNITPSISDNRATFTLNQTNKVWITVNNDDANPLFVFADGPKPTIPTNCHLLYFGPGVTTIDRYQALSGQTIYLDGGSIVRGSILLTGTKNVQIVGPGILSGDLWTAETVQALPFNQKVAYSLIYGDNVYYYSDRGNQATVSGITLLNSPFYNFWFGASTASHVKLLSPWYFSTDGFEGVNTVDQSFAFVGDNVFFPAHAGANGGNISVTNSFVGCTNNAVFNGGYWGQHPVIQSSFSSLVDNVDIKTYTNGAWGTHTPAIFQIWINNTDSTWGHSNQTYRNIRIEGNLKSNLAELKNVPYPAAWGGNSYNPPLGNSAHFLFQNITLAGNQTGMSEIQGYNSNNGFQNITWKNLTINGTAVTNLNASTYFSTNAFIWNLNFQ